MRPPFSYIVRSEQNPEGNRHELIDAAPRFAARDAVVSGLEKSGEWSEAECRAESGVDAEIILRFRTGDVDLRVVEAATGNDVNLGS